MNKPLGPYELSRTELATLREIIRSPISISALAKRIRKSQPVATEVVQRLKARGFVTVERVGTKKLVRLSKAKHAQLLRDIMLANPHVPWESLLSFSHILPLLRSEGAASAPMSRTTEWRSLKNLMAHGIVSRGEGRIKINPKFNRVAEFIHEFSSFVNSMLAAQASESAVIIWASGSQFIIRVPEGEKIRDSRFKPTATTALPEYGVPLISNVEYYYYSPIPGKLKAEDVLLHTLLVDGVTNVTYALVLLAKAKINRELLLRKAEMLNLKDQVMAMFKFLDTRERQIDSNLPTWTEFEQKARDYGVKL
jgi:predicted transcriptional regulator